VEDVEFRANTKTSFHKSLGRYGSAEKRRGGEIQFLVWYIAFYPSQISAWHIILMVLQSPDSQLIDSSILFRFSVPCYHCSKRWNKKRIALSEKYILPCFDRLDESPSTEKKSWAEVRLAWNAEGIILNLTVEGKKQMPWCRLSRIEDSDGIAVWVNTRSGSQIHRAGRFCHAFRFLPLGGGSSLQQPIASQVEIRRATENAKMHTDHPPQIRGQCHNGGYAVQAFVPAQGLAGYDPEEHPQIGFHFVVSDRELGTRSMTLGESFPTDADPSLWSTLELVDS